MFKMDLVYNGPLASAGTYTKSIAGYDYLKVFANTEVSPNHQFYYEVSGGPAGTVRAGSPLVTYQKVAASGHGWYGEYSFGDSRFNLVTTSRGWWRVNSAYKTPTFGTGSYNSVSRIYGVSTGATEATPWIQDTLWTGSATAGTLTKDITAYDIIRVFGKNGYQWNFSTEFIPSGATYVHPMFYYFPSGSPSLYSPSVYFNGKSGFNLASGTYQVFTGSNGRFYTNNSLFMLRVDGIKTSSN